MYSKNKISDIMIIEEIKTGNTMNTCAINLGIKFSTFKRRAILLGVYTPNQGRKGIKRNSSEFNKITISLYDIISGKHEGHYTSSRLRKRLIKEGYKKNQCEEITCELHHIDGNRGNNRLENLLILCPNCHSQTPNHSKRNA
jgi:hypothetical protein